MKILLIGEYYTVHWTLAQALRDLGHNVNVLSNDNLWPSTTDYLSIMNNPTQGGNIQIHIQFTQNTSPTQRLRCGSTYQPIFS